MKIFIWLWGLLWIANGLEAQKLTRRAVLGIEVAEKDQSIFISKVIAGTPAEKVGIKINDELLSLNGQKPQSYQEVARIVKNAKPNEHMQVLVKRNSQLLNLNVHLEELPKEITWQYRTMYDELPTSNALLRTIITAPPKTGKYPAVMFVQGVGCYPIDTPFDTTFGHVQVLRYLSKNNIVTMRVEKSGVGDSQGEPCEKIDFQTELNHFSEALRTLKTYPFVDSANIFVIGHSLGGVMAPIIARKENAKGVIVYGTIGQNWTNYLIDSRKAMAISKGEDLEDVEEWVKTVTDCSVRYFLQKQALDSIIKQNEECKNFLKKFSFRDTKYWYQLSDLNIAQQWKEYKGYVLSIWGEADKNTMESEHQAIVNIVNKNHPKKATFLKISRTDHKMCLRNPQDTYVEKDFNPQVAESIYEWINRVRGGL
ncbi:MAG: hypothetical protein OHK0045_24850 [Raineya sp.]